jgi:glycopeptide antibiotics resistance protein
LIFIIVEFLEVKYTASYLLPNEEHPENNNRIIIIYATGIDINSFILPTFQMILQSFGYNIILFLPFGFLVPILYKKYSTLIKIILTSFIFSLLIEITQLIIMIITFSSIRVFDIDDILANVTGGIIGYYIYLCLNKITHRKIDKFGMI